MTPSLSDYEQLRVAWAAPAGDVAPGAVTDDIAEVVDYTGLSTMMMTGQIPIVDGGLTLRSDAGMAERGTRSTVNRPPNIELAFRPLRPHGI